MDTNQLPSKQHCWRCNVLTHSCGPPAETLTQYTFMGMRLKGHLLGISNTPSLLFSAVSNPVHSSYEVFPGPSWHRPHCWAGFPQRSACVNQAQNCHQGCMEECSLSQSTGEATGPRGTAPWPQQCVWALHVLRKETPKRLREPEGAQGPGSGSASWAWEGHIHMWINVCSVYLQAGLGPC